MGGGRGTSGHCGVSVARGSSCTLNKVFTGSWLCLNQIATSLTTNVIKANAGSEAIVQEGSWLNCTSLWNPSFSPLLKPTWTAVFGGVNGRYLLAFLQGQTLHNRSPGPTSRRKAGEQRLGWEEAARARGRALEGRRALF